ncbi:acetyl-CoA acetyltransferase [Ilumatobacter nonamiensis]|uniref:acetyl-CoA acetyltransferase n=1 Tax=Ilumatobacter nonamiensis TaxID=467093 RepID=UPI00034BBC80|nr:acetyl-CoA acetyltransferase [Ilumatobacter nonamiensis]
MTLDPRTPVIVGVGQYNHRADSLDDALEPAALMERAVLNASADAGLDGPPTADSVRVVSIIGWRYRNAPRFLAERLGIDGAELAQTTNGGNSPQSLVNRTALDIGDGTIDVAVLAGAEAFRTFMRARKENVRLPWPKADDDDQPIRLGAELDMNHPVERDLGIVMPIQVYPMFETALRAAAGRTVEEHQAHLGRLWSDLSHVAAGNPDAWIRDPKSPEEITTVSSSNRMIGFPYPKLMNSNSDVDMGAALIMCSVEAARRMGIDESKWVFPHAGTDCHEHNFVSNRDTFARTPAIELGGRRALELADTSIDEVELIDLYSCFPAAVQLGAQSLGIDLTERQWSRTGGLPFCGGPWNNYPMHAIATMVGELREQEDARGLVWANGGYATKHSFGVYSATPPADGFRYQYPQDEIDALPKRDLASGADAVGSATIEAYSVMFSRSGSPETAYAACLRDDGRRAWGTSTDPQLAAALCEGEWVGTAVRLDADSTLTV